MPRSPRVTLPVTHGRDTDLLVGIPRRGINREVLIPQPAKAPKPADHLGWSSPAVEAVGPEAASKLGRRPCHGAPVIAIQTRSGERGFAVELSSRAARIPDQLSLRTPHPLLTAFPTAREALFRTMTASGEVELTGC